MDVNTTSKHPTHFLRGVELVYEGMERWNIPSENWPYPTEYRVGTSNFDSYYAEVWVNGMDWQPTYWMIEHENLNPPRIYPFIMFEDNDDRSKFIDYDFGELICSCFWYRRNDVWIRKDIAESYYSDMVWPHLYVKKGSSFQGVQVLYEAFFEHASQPKVKFGINPMYVPERCMDEEHWNNWHTKKGHIGSVQESVRPVS